MSFLLFCSDLRVQLRKTTVSALLTLCIPVAAAAAKSLQSCPTLCDPIDCSLPGFSVHGILQAPVLEWGAIAFSLSCMSCLYILEVNSLSVVSFAIIFSHSEGCLFTLLIVSFVVQKTPQKQS